MPRQVDKSYTEEIAELRKTQSELKHEEGALMRQRAQDMRKLQDERVQRYSMVLRGVPETGVLALFRLFHVPFLLVSR